MFYPQALLAGPMPSPCMNFGRITLGGELGAIILIPVPEEVKPKEELQYFMLKDPHTEGDNDFFEGDSGLLIGIDKTQLILRMPLDGSETQDIRVDAGECEETTQEEYLMHLQTVTSYSKEGTMSIPAPAGVYTPTTTEPPEPVEYYKLVKDVENADYLFLAGDVGISFGWSSAGKLNLQMDVGGKGKGKKLNISVGSECVELTTEEVYNEFINNLFSKTSKEEPKKPMMLIDSRLIDAGDQEIRIGRIVTLDSEQGGEPHNIGIVEDLRYDGVDREAYLLCIDGKGISSRLWLFARDLSVGTDSDIRTFTAWFNRIFSELKRKNTKLELEIVELKKHPEISEDVPMGESARQEGQIKQHDFVVKKSDYEANGEMIIGIAGTVHDNDSITVHYHDKACSRAENIKVGNLRRASSAAVADLYIQEWTSVIALNRRIRAFDRKLEEIKAEKGLDDLGETIEKVHDSMKDRELDARKRVIEEQKTKIEELRKGELSMQDVITGLRAEIDEVRKNSKKTIKDQEEQVRQLGRELESLKALYRSSTSVIAGHKVAFDINRYEKGKWPLKFVRYADGTTPKEIWLKWGGTSPDGDQKVLYTKDASDVTWKHNEKGVVLNNRGVKMESRLLVMLPTDDQA